MKNLFELVFAIVCAIISLPICLVMGISIGIYKGFRAPILTIRDHMAEFRTTTCTLCGCTFNPKAETGTDKLCGFCNAGPTRIAGMKRTASQLEELGLVNEATTYNKEIERLESLFQ
jgi:hypothetical protein